MKNKYLIALSTFLPFGPVRIKLMVTYFSSAEKAWNASKKELIAIGLNQDTINNFITYRQNFDIDSYLLNLAKLSIKVLTNEDNEYPVNLKDLNDSPVVLYVRGILKKEDENAVAIVGSRKMSTYGKDVARAFSRELAGLGITIVSGLAFGVDKEAQNAAVNIGGRCIAVLAGGVDVITPRSNEWLGLKILKEKGAIISEFPPGTIPQRHFFPFRNRIISGLSKAVIVIEGEIKSGTIHTVKHAADQGRQVFAVPGQIFSPLSQGPLYLIKQGAKMITSISDVLEDLDLQVKVNGEKVKKILPSNESEEKIMINLPPEDIYIDDLARITGLTASEISASLTVMELKGMVKNMGNGLYKKS